jgi:RNA polymerase sigma-70 factor (family 1)
MHQLQINLINNPYLYSSMEEVINTELTIEQKYESLFINHYEALVRYANTMLSNVEESEDMVQSTYLELWKDRSKINFTEEVKAYLYKGVYFKCMNKFKHDKVHVKYINRQSNQAEFTESDSLVENELQTKIDTAIDTLPEQCKKIFLMSRIDNKKYNEIASELSISPKTVENQMGKALKVLRIALADFLHFIIITILTIL